MLFIGYHNHKNCVNVGAPTLLLLLLLSVAARADDDSSLLQAENAFTAAFQQRDSTAAAKLLAPDFVWIDSVGKRLTRAQALATFPVIANAGAAPQARDYGNSAVVWANQGKMNVLHVWVKTAVGWQILLYQEVMQVEKSEPVNRPALWRLPQSLPGNSVPASHAIRKSGHRFLAGRDARHGGK